MAYGDGKQALLEAAIQIAAAEGLRGLTYRAVAAAAGVSHGSVRYHFGDRATLIKAALSYAAEHSIPDAARDSGAGGIVDFGMALAELVSKNPEVQVFQYEMGIEGRRRPDLVAANQRAYDEYASAGADALRHDGIDDPDLVDVFLAALDGLVLRETIFGDTDRTRRSMSKIATLVAALTPERDEEFASPTNTMNI